MLCIIAETMKFGTAPTMFFVKSEVSLQIYCFKNFNAKMMAALELNLICSKL